MAPPFFAPAAECRTRQARSAKISDFTRMISVPCSLNKNHAKAACPANALLSPTLSPLRPHGERESNGPATVAVSAGARFGLVLRDCFANESGLGRWLDDGGPAPGDSPTVS